MAFWNHQVRRFIQTTAARQSGAHGSSEGIIFIHFLHRNFQILELILLTKSSSQSRVM